MKDQYIRQRMLEQNMKWTAERNAFVEKALASEDYDEKDEYYRQAAVLGIRLDSIAKVIREISDVNCSDQQRTRAFQRHNRDMERLKYRKRPAHLLQDAIDTEVISQFYKDGVVVNNPEPKPMFLTH